MQTKYDIVREVGYLERFQVALTHTGLDSCVVVSGEYRAAESTINPATLYPALREVILRHSGLGVQLTKDDPMKKFPHFVRLPSISLDTIVEFVQDDRMSLDAHFMAQLVKHFELETAAPLWRLVVLKGRTIFFAYHHAIGDGQSGPAFHHALLTALNDTRPETTPDTIVTIPSDISLIPPMESLMSTPVSLRVFCNTLYPILVPTSWTRGYRAWTCNPIPRKTTFKMHVRCWSLPSARATQLIELCRSHNTTLTAFLHTLASLALAKFAPKQKQYKTITTAVPISLRRYTGTPPSELCDQVTMHRSYVPIPLESKKAADGRDRDGFPWETAAQYGARLHGSMNRSRELVGMLRYLFGLGVAQDYFVGSLGKKREYTLLLSNLGRFPAQDVKGADENQVARTTRWTIGEVLFAQADGVHGPAVKVNVVGCPDGGLGITFSWGEGAIDQNTVEAFIEEAKASLLAVLD